MSRSRKYLIILFALVFIISCTKDIGKVNYGNYPPDVGKIISLNCAVSGCHNGASSAAANGLNLETWMAMFSGSNNGSPVIPFSSKYSSLCYFINTYSDLGSQNTPVMPLNKNPLSYDEVKLIKDWIDKGAYDVDGNVMWANNPQRKKLYAANQGCDVVTVFDAETQLPIRFIELGTKPSVESPHQIRVSPDGQFWYVMFIDNNIMQKFRCSDDSYVGSIPLTPMAAGTGTINAGDWNTFVITKDGKRAYCVSWTTNGSIAAVDLENGKLLHYLGGQHEPHGIALNADETKFYVCAQRGNYISEIDTAFSEENQYSLQNGMPIIQQSSLDLHDVILAPNNNDLVITCQQTNQVRIFNIPSKSVTAEITTGVFPQEIVYSKSTNQYFVSCTEDSTSFPGKKGVITRINANDYSATNLQCGFEPHGIAVDENKKLLYVLSRNVSAKGPAPHHTSECTGKNGFVNFIDLNTFTVLSKKYELSVDPYFISPRP